MTKADSLDINISFVFVHLVEQTIECIRDMNFTLKLYISSKLITLIVLSWAQLIFLIIRAQLAIPPVYRSFLLTPDR